MDSGIRLRLASPEDAAALLEIYRPYVEQTAITFEYAVPTEEAFAERIRNTLARYPYLVAEDGIGRPVGYAYASQFKERRAYDWAVELSIYVAMDARGQGIGSALYERLELLLRRQQVANANACIAYPNPDSIAFHERHGYKTVAHFTKCGYKNGCWWDMVWMEKMLGPHPAQPEAFVPFPSLGGKPADKKADA